MIGRRIAFGALLAAAVGALTFVTATETFAQQRGNSAANRAHAGHGWQNRNSWSHRSADRRIGHAIEYSRDLRDYGSVPRTGQAQPASVPIGRYPVIVTEEVGRNITAARQDLAAAKKAPEVAKDPEALKSFATIDKHLAAAAEQHATMMECCEGEECDGEMLMKCCDAAVDALEKARAENTKLMQRLYPDAKTTGEHSHGPRDEKPATKN